jgi:LuxR family maltose regulon positive regulatory protein
MVKKEVVFMLIKQLSSFSSVQVAPREELMKLMDAAASKHMMYVRAPAGYGKTFSVKMWSSCRDKPRAWVAVSESVGRKPADFCMRLIHALSVLQPDNNELKPLAEYKTFNAAPFEFVEKALNSFRLFASFAVPAAKTSERKYILVIDDLHLVTNPDILKQLPEIISDLSDSTVVCILSRAKPPDSFSEFVIKDMMAVVGIEDLKFSKNEIKALFSLHGQELTERQAMNIIASTDGWAIGLNAIILSGENKNNRKQLSWYLETFIKENIWEKWDDERRKFLLSVSVMDELTPEFCEHMTGRKDSTEMLDELVRENAFISIDNEKIYRFHHLFQDFLRNILGSEGEQKRKAIYQKAGDWFHKCENYYGAVEYYMKSGDKSGVTKGLKLMYNYNSPYAAIVDTLSVIRLSVDELIVSEHPFLLEVQAWAAFVEGRGEAMEGYLDRYFKQLPKIIIKNPASAQTALLLKCMDYRNSMIDVTKSLKKLPLNLFAHANTPSLSQNLPLFHRSGRDFSEYVFNTDENLVLLRKTIGVLVREYSVAEDLIRGGLAYEQGFLNKAYDCALSASVNLKDEYAPEIKFCAYMLLSTVLAAQEYSSDALKILVGAEAMIEQDKAYYLNQNFRAFSCLLKMADSDTEAAQEWLKHDAEPLYGELTFFKLYQHFTTARAYIATSEFNAAILFLNKLKILCEKYRRPIDIIEINILLAVAYWKKARASQNKAFEMLEEAIISARKYGYVQMFANEGAELSNMLHKLQKRVIQKDYSGALSSLEVKNLYILAVAKGKYKKGLTGGRLPVNLKFTERQKTVMKHLCDGLTHKEIGIQMGLKYSAIKSHMILIYKKLDVSNGVDAVIKIREMNVLD